ncbi:hypothetical protein [Proteus penneri]|uniref:hypothetical protein n=1 Tax=Proteus penneri TaxID=102862 RepID=UPI000E00CBD9|nr:hypothetical protein [Proteus penneri]HCT7990797.1 hypothetical protein [Proteus mirabilis]SUB98606.1 Uncharacterised protein [Proteus penneri]HEJ0135597.1 hypothetical protein [Proteus mirabilis]HEJ9747922.1 hypothetical protein [Proteus mirabilis]HEK3120923.1 hypothetical protein [Proteus mirabilis]
MNKKNCFFQEYQSVCNDICYYLGNEWRINKIKSWDLCIILTSPKYKDYSIYFRPEKGRINISGSIYSRLFRYSCNYCTVSENRKPQHIANDIKRKILANIDEEIKKYIEDLEYYNNNLEQDKILKGMISRFGKLNDYHNSFTGFKLNNGIKGEVNRRYRGNQQLVIDDLNVDKLIKIIGFVSTLD